MRLATRFYPEPSLEFGEGEAFTPKQGLAEWGPYTLRLGATHPARVRIGLVGPPQAAEGLRAFLQSCRQPLASGSKNLALAPPYPGFDTVFRCPLALDSHWDMEVDADALTTALSEPPSSAFQRTQEMYAHAIEHVGRRDLRPDIVICALPQELIDRCGRVENRRLTPSEKAWLRTAERDRASGQMSLFDLIGQQTVESESQPAPEDLLYRDFRRALKLSAMRSRVPIQIATPQLWQEGLRGQQDAATRAWNATVAIYYKGAGIPWRIGGESSGTCFVGITFHHLRTTRRHIVHSSLAQGFSPDGEGFAMRGEAAPWSESDRIPHLTGAQAHALIARVLEAYRERLGRDPVRLVVHKTSKFHKDEEDGIRSAANEVPNAELFTLRSGEFRTVRQGTYPPHRGSLFRIADASYLFTAGYMPEHRTYPGAHIPVPIEILPTGSADVERAASDLLALTKMNWNSAASYSSLPITLGFARRVGAIMAEIPEGEEPEPSFRYYM